MNIISNLLNSSLNYFFYSTGDLGIAIILLTISVRFMLMPLSFKQKLSMQAQQKISKELEQIKETYKNNKEKLDSETKKYYKQNAKGILGCLTSLLQIPVIFTLYNVVLTMPMQVGTILVPWVVSLKMSDSFFIVPVVYAISTLSPNILPYVPFLKITAQAKLSKANIVITSIMSALITFNAPVALGLYFIASSLFSLVEEIVFRLYIRRKAATI